MKSNLTIKPSNGIVKLAVLASLVVLFIAGCGQADPSKQDDTAAHAQVKNVVTTAAEQIKITLGIDHNYTTENCPEGSQACYQATMTLVFPAEMPSNWRIMFSNLSPINKAISNEFNLVHMNGDMHEITSKVDTLNPNTPYEIVFFGGTPLISESVLFPNYLLADGNGETRVIASTTERLFDGHQVARPQHVKAFTKPEQFLRNANDKVAIANSAERFDRFSSRGASIKTSPVASSNQTDNRIIPMVNSAQWLDETIALNQGVQLPDLSSIPEEIRANFSAALTQRFISNGLQISAEGLLIKANLDTQARAESYTLIISASEIQVTHADSAGLYYAMMSIAQLFDATSQSLPVGSVQDQASMGFRGLHIDVSRNFRSKDFILKTIDQMSYYKLNKLHFHLADDEGWRLQIASLPELTDVGAFRCFDESEQRCLLPQLAGGDGKSAATQQNSGYYSVDDYIEILQYAQARQIEVLPSLDMPGHSRATIVAMNARYNRLMLEEKPDDAKQYFLTELEDKSVYSSIQHYNDNTLNPCLPATYTFIEEVLKQLNDMHNAAGVPLKHYHIGADETAGAWADSPACAGMIAENDELTEVKQLGSYFIEKVARKVSDLGIVPAAWSDGLGYANPNNLPLKVQANAWETLYSGGHNKAHKMINKGWEVVLSTPDVLYFDFPYEADPIEPGYYWGSRYTDSYQVFQFMPMNLPVHAEIWKDKFGNSYEANATIDIEQNGQIAGIQAQLWSETVRSNEHAVYMLFPRLLAVAERAWNTPIWAESYQAGVSYSDSSGHFDAEKIAAMNADWISFTYVLSQKAMPQLVKDGIEPRVPLPGAKIEEGMLHMYSAFAGLQLEYQVAGQAWQAFEGPVPVTSQDAISVRATIPLTQVSSRVQILSKGGL